MNIEHLAPGMLAVDVVRRFLKESSEAYPVEVGTPDLIVWPEKLATKADCFCMRRADGSLAAALFAYLDGQERHICYVPFICSLPECGKGVAWNLHEHCVHHVISLGWAVMMLEVMKSNSHALNSYLRQGYSILADHGDRGRWLMELDLGHLRKRGEA